MIRVVSDDTGISDVKWVSDDTVVSDDTGVGDGRVVRDDRGISDDKWVGGDRVLSDGKVVGDDTGIGDDIMVSDGMGLMIQRKQQQSTNTYISLYQNKDSTTDQLLLLIQFEQQRHIYIVF